MYLKKARGRAKSLLWQNHHIVCTSRKKVCGVEPQKDPRMSKSWQMRRNEEGVSPVIGTILMVAITVVLAAVLYTMVSGWGNRRDWTDPIVLSVQKTGNNWSMQVTSAPSGLALSEVTMTIRDPNGATMYPMSAVPLSELTEDNWDTYKAYYQKTKASEDTVNAGATILLDFTTYSAGCHYDLIGGSSVLASGAL